MKVCVCPACGTLHEAASALVLNGLNEEATYQRTHCRFCERPSSSFRPRPDEPDLAPGELGYPIAVVPWMTTGG